MLELRHDQIARLSEAAWTDLERRMLEHVQRCWPAQCASRGGDATLRSVQDAIARCRSRGLTRDRDIGRFIDLCFCFDDDFERLPWAQAALARRAPSAQAELACLWDAARRALSTPEQP